MKKLFNGVRIPIFIAFLLTLASCGSNTKQDPGPCQSCGGGGGTAPTLAILPGVNISVPYNGIAVFTPITNGVRVTVDGATVSGTFTGTPLTANHNYVVVAYASNNADSPIKTDTVRVSVGENPVITNIKSGPWRIFKKEGQLTGPWFEYTLNPCELDDTQKFNADGSVTWLDNANQCSPVPYPPGSWSLSYPDSLNWNTVNRGILKAASDTLRLQWATPCSGGGCPASGLALVRVTYIK